ncbi:MAG: CmcJ/NvfI family oxidoreductase [Steroidobacteraceae bacterium]
MSDTAHRTFGRLGFSEPMAARPRFYANDNSLDALNVVPREVPIEDLRHRPAPPSLDIEGFRLYPHRTAVRDFRDRAEIERMHVEEIRELILSVSGADHVIVTGAGILRFGERSRDSGAHDNSRPARFVHVDVSDSTATAFYARSLPDAGRRVRRSAQYNVWRAISAPPQDVPLAVCDARSLAGEDFIAADAIFDRDGTVVFSFEALLLRHNSRQRWAFYSDMHRDEALIFKTHDTDPTCAHCVPHGAFDHPECPADVSPRASIEMRGIAYWFE